MGKLLSRNAAIAYLRESCGSMSMKVFMNEVHAGRIPAKPYGKNYRYRQEDLDLWQINPYTAGETNLKNQRTNKL